MIHLFIYTMVFHGLVGLLATSPNPVSAAGSNLVLPQNYVSPTTSADMC